LKGSGEGRKGKMREMEIGNRRGERRRKKGKDEGKGERGEKEGAGHRN
jgi:hypothetical protein